MSAPTSGEPTREMALLTADPTAGVVHRTLVIARS